MQCTGWQEKDMECMSLFQLFGGLRKGLSISLERTSKGGTMKSTAALCAVQGCFPRKQERKAE